LEKQETFGVPELKFADATTEPLKNSNTETVPGKPGRMRYMTMDKSRDQAMQDWKGVLRNVKRPSCYGSPFRLILSYWIRLRWLGKVIL